MGVLQVKDVRFSVNKSTRVGYGLAWALFVVVGLFLAIVCAVALITTVIYMDPTTESPRVLGLVSEMWLLPLFGLVGGLLVTAALRLVHKAAVGLPEWAMLAGLLVVSTAFGLWWVLIQDVDTSRFGDSFRLLLYAKNAANGDWGWFTQSASTSLVSQIPDDAHLYFLEYPFQAGVFCYFYVFYRFFGDLAVKALLVANVLADEVAIACVYGIARLFGKDKDCGCGHAALILLVLCVPLHLSAAFPYGNNVGLAFGALFLFLQCQAFARESLGARFVLILVSLVPLSLTLMIKSTFILFGIAAVIAWVISAIKDKKPGLAVASLAVLMVSSSLSSIPVNLLESKVGYSFGDGMPKTSWLVLGSSRSELTGAAGWWDAQAVEIFINSEGDSSIQFGLSLAGLRSNYSELLSDPMGAADFYVEKLATEWADPTFEFFFYAGMNAKDFDQFFDPYAALGTQPPAAVVVGFLDAVQTAVYLLALAGLLTFIKERDLFGPQLLLVATFFSGFGCYLLWEAKGIYLLPFYVLLLPLASKGLTAMGSILWRELESGVSKSA